MGIKIGQQNHLTFDFDAVEEDCLTQQTASADEAIVTVEEPSKRRISDAFPSSNIDVGVLAVYTAKLF